MITCNSPIFNGQNPGTLFEQLGEAAGGGVADHLGNLSHGEISVDKQMLCLTHSPSLDVLGDAAPKLPFEAAFQLAFTHAGDIRKALERQIKGVVIGNVADHILQALYVLH